MMQIVGRAEKENNSAILNKQAKTLQTSLALLLEPPMGPGHQPLPDVELSPREIKVLMLLGENGETIMTELAAGLPVPLSTLTRIVDRLERKQLIERFRSAEDRRIVIVREAAQGKLLRGIFRGSQLDLAARMLTPLSNGEREILLELLQKLTRGLEAGKL